MSFLHCIARPHKQQPSNRAIRELYKGKLVHKLLPKTEDKSGLTQSRFCHLKSSPIDPRDLPAPPPDPVHSLKHRPTSNASRSKYFLLKQTNCERDVDNPQVTDHEMIMRHHDSFSSYLLKNKSSSRNSSRLSRNFRYFDLDEIANQLASPKPLENKLESEEHSLDNRKHKLSLKHCQFFLNNLQQDKDRYHGPQPPARRPRLHIRSNNFLQADFKHRRTAKHRQSTQPQRKHDLIRPWNQNEQQHSPLPRQRQINTQIGCQDLSFPK